MNSFSLQSCFCPFGVDVPPGRWYTGSTINQLIKLSNGFILHKQEARAAVDNHLAEGDPKTPDTMTNYARLADLPVTKCRDAAALAAQPFDAVVDALYGTGFHGSLRPAGLAACALMNRQRESGAFVLAVDLPSGINTDTGEAAEGAVRADLTVTFDSCKPLHTAPSSAPFCGEIVCADIGIRDEWHPAGLAQL